MATVNWHREGKERKWTLKCGKKFKAEVARDKQGYLMKHDGLCLGYFTNREHVELAALTLADRADTVAYATLYAPAITYAEALAH